MGVKGLWKVLKPAGRVAKLQDLRDVGTVSIDISAWIHRAIKAAQGSEQHHSTQMLVKRVLNVVFKRVCKLLYLGVYPVFVFDGAPPQIKQKYGMAKRKEHQERMQRVIRKHVAKRFYLHLHAGKATSTMKFQDVELERPEREFTITVPEEHSDKRLPLLPSERSQQEEKVEKEVDVNVERKVPLELRLARLAELEDEAARLDEVNRLRDQARSTSLQRLAGMIEKSKNSLDFSRLQVQHLLERNRLTHETHKITNFGVLLKHPKQGAFQARRVASDRTRCIWITSKPNETKPSTALLPSTRLCTLDNNIQSFPLVGSSRTLTAAYAAKTLSSTSTSLKKKATQKEKDEEEEEEEWAEVEVGVPEVLRPFWDILPDNFSETFATGREMILNAASHWTQQELTSARHSCARKMEELRDQSGGNIAVHLENLVFWDTILDAIIRNRIATDIKLIKTSKENTNQEKSKNFFYEKKIEVKNEKHSVLDTSAFMQLEKIYANEVKNKDFKEIDIDAKAATEEDVFDEEPSIQKDYSLDDEDFEDVAFNVLAQIENEEQSLGVPLETVAPSSISNILFGRVKNNEQSGNSTLEKSVDVETQLNYKIKGEQEDDGNTGFHKRRKLDDDENIEPELKAAGESENEIAEQGIDENEQRKVENAQEDKKQWLGAEPGDKSNEEAYDDDIGDIMQEAVEISSKDDHVKLEDVLSEMRDQVVALQVDDAKDHVAQNVVEESAEKSQERRGKLIEQALLADQLNRAVAQSAEVTNDLYRAIKAMLVLFRVPYVTAPSEAEAECAFLEKTGQVKAVVTDDSDAFLFGATKVLRNLFALANQQVEEYTIAKIKQEIGITRDAMVRLAQLLGCDYCPGVYGVGPASALKIEHRFKDLRAYSEYCASDTTIDKIVKAKWFPQGFPDREVTEAFLRPLVSGNHEPFVWGEPDVQGLVKFMCANAYTDPYEIESTLTPVLRKIKESGGPPRPHAKPAILDLFQQK